MLCSFSRIRLKTLLVIRLALELNAFIIVNIVSTNVVLPLMIHCRPVAQCHRLCHPSRCSACSSSAFVNSFASSLAQRARLFRHLSRRLLARCVSCGRKGFSNSLYPRTPIPQTPPQPWHSRRRVLSDGIVATDPHLKQLKAQRSHRADSPSAPTALKSASPL